MDCPNCQSSNPDTARFCLNCGVSLQQSCPNCATDLPASAKFCSTCGKPLTSVLPSSNESPLKTLMPAGYVARLEKARSNRAMEGERRVVTILFSDVQGSTAIASGLDPEEWAEIMNQAFEHLILPVYQYEGTVGRLMGDGILAFFGAPIAHEDDPQRAVLAGLEIVSGIQHFREQVKRQYSEDFDVRVGINTGLVVVGEVGSDLLVEYTAMGDAINLAARMEQSAEPGTVRITHDTYKLIAPLFDVVALGSIDVKGKMEPVPVYRVLKPKAQPGSLRGIKGLETPLIGRDQEMETFQRLLADLHGGSGHIVNVMGEAGLGKSRLVAELRQTVQESQEQERPPTATPMSRDMRWLEGRAFSFETSTPYAIFMHLFNDWLFPAQGQTVADPYGHIERRVAEILGERAIEVAPFVASLLGTPVEGEAAQRIKYLEPPQYRARLFEAVSEYLEHLAHEKPLILVFDDIHWADSASLDLLQHLLPLTDRAPLMFINLFRPHRQEPSWRLHERAEREYRHRYTPLMLHALEEDQARRLVAHLLHVEDLPDSVRTLILEKAEGNPFYVEEVVRSLIDSELLVRENGHWHATQEINRIAVPDTLAGVITARLDRLDAPAKRLVQVAAVIGRLFQQDLLAQLLESPSDLETLLLELQRRELIRQKQRFPQPLYQFKHALVEETAYRSLLLRNRREIHRRIAMWLEENRPDQVNEIAYHYVAARVYRPALPYLLEAGNRAARSYSIPEAIAHYTQILDHADPPQDLKLAQKAYEGLGSALTFANEIPRAVATYEAMLDLAESYNDIPMQISGLNKLSFVVALRLGQFPEAEQRLSNAERLAREYQDTEGLSELFLVRCMMCTAVADFEGVERYMGEAVALGRERNEEEQMVIGLSHVATTQLFMTRFEEAWQTAQQALQLARQLGDREHEATVQTYILSYLHLRNGDLDAARAVALQGTKLAHQIGSAMAELPGTWVLGLVAQLSGAYEEAIEWHKRILELSRSAGIPWFELLALCSLGTLHLEISPQLLDETRRLHDEALKLIDSPASIFTAAVALAELGFCAQAIGELDRASAYFQKGLNSPSMHMNVERPRLLAGCAIVAIAQDQPEEAVKFIDEASHFATARGMKHLYPMLAFFEGRIRVSRGETERAIERFQYSRTLAEEMGMRHWLWQADMELAQLFLQLGQTEDSARYKAQARVTIDEIAGDFKDRERGALFIESANSRVNAPPG